MEMEKSEEPLKEEEKGFKAKTCKGCLYYSSVLKSKSQSPVCVGLSKTFPHVPENVMRNSKRKASEGPGLSDYKYVCVGYSIKLDTKDSAADSEDRRVELPFCLGVKLLMDNSLTAGHDHHEEDGQATQQPRPLEPAHAREEFLGRLTRNAGVVASGVARNVYRVGNYIKANVEDMLYPYRRRSK